MATIRFEIEVEVLDDEEYDDVIGALQNIGADVIDEREV